MRGHCRRQTIAALRPFLAALLPALFVAAMPAAAQTTIDGQLWLNGTATGSISGDLVHFTELQPRFGDRAGGLDQLVVRAGLGWRLSPAVTVYQGYAYVETPRELGPSLKEDRSFQQLSLNIGQIGRGELAGRTRFEQRWRSNGDDVGIRLRQLLRYRYPLQDRNAPVAALGWVEGFLNLNGTDWGTADGFDRIRAFAGLELPVAGRSTVEAGYMNQTVDEALGGTSVHHVASFTLFFRH